MIANKEIGWSNEANLLWEISRQLDRTLRTICTGVCTTTTTTTTASPTTTTTTTESILLSSIFLYPLTQTDCVITPKTIDPVEYYTSAGCAAVLIVGCIIYTDIEGTILLDDGYYSTDGGITYFYILNGEVMNFDTCPQI